MRPSRLCLLSLLLPLAAAPQEAGIDAALKKPLLDPIESKLEIQVWSAAKVPPLPLFRTPEAWRDYAARLRRRILDEVVFRGEARKWRDAPLKVEWLETLPGGSDYQVRKFRVEAVPGLWVAGLLYRPLALKPKTAAVLNVNGHEKEGKSTPYIQERCIHLARSGLLAMNLEWLGRGQMQAVPGLHHYRMPQIDLTGTSGIAVFFLAMRKGLDVLETLPEIDRTRIAVTGLSGGGWQTIFLSGLDERVAAANPLAGYSGFVTRAQWPELDLGDAEQTPSDFASVADYLHLTAMLAPRWAQLANNAKDNCCFRADYALGPLVQAARTTYNLLGVPERLRYHVNFGAGHNYDAENREAFYRFIRDAFFGGKDFPIVERPLEKPVKTAQELTVELPADNLDFNSLAMRLARGLPRNPDLPKTRAAASAWQLEARKRLRRIIRAHDFALDARPAGTATESGIQVRYWRLKMDRAWTVPAVELIPPQASGLAVVVADDGRASAAAAIQKLLDARRRVLALDPFYFGESKIATRDFLFGLLVAALGERPIGLQASQVMAAARWFKREHGGAPLRVVALGPRSSLFALMASALEAKAVDELSLHRSFASLQQILEQNLSTDRTPELFCFGLLEAFDIRQMAALVAPRPARFTEPGARAGQELAPLRDFYKLLGSDVDPLQAE